MKTYGNDWFFDKTQTNEGLRSQTFYLWKKRRRFAKYLISNFSSLFRIEIDKKKQTRNTKIDSITIQRGFLYKKMFSVQFSSSQSTRLDCASLRVELKVKHNLPQAPYSLVRSLLQVEYNRESYYTVMWRIPALLTWWPKRSHRGHLSHLI